MKYIKKSILFLLGAWVVYILYIYTTSPRITYILPKEYEGPLLIIANQQDGIIVDPSNTIYNFTNSPILKIKGNLTTGFIPFGYLKYYCVDKTGKKNELKITNKSPEKENNKSEIYVWDVFHKTGACKNKGNETTEYESLVISKKTNVYQILEKQFESINKHACLN